MVHSFKVWPPLKRNGRTPLWGFCKCLYKQWTSLFSPHTNLQRDYRTQPTGFSWAENGHIRACAGLPLRTYTDLKRTKTDKRSRGDRPTMDNQPAKPRNPHPPSTATHTVIGLITNTLRLVIYVTFFAAPVHPSVPPHLYKCGGSRITTPAPTAFQRTEHIRKPYAQEGLVLLPWPHFRRTFVPPFIPSSFTPPEINQKKQ